MIAYKLTDYNYNSILATGRYRRIYKPGSTVIAEPNTLGLMLFYTYKNAKNFYEKMKDCLGGKGPFKILAVYGIGEKTTPIQVGLVVRELYLDNFYDYIPPIVYLTPPPGTICFQTVKVLYQEGPSLGL